MNAKQRNAVDRVRRDLVRLDKSLDNLEAEFSPKPFTGSMKIKKAKDPSKASMAPYASLKRKGSKSTPKSHGMNKKGGQK